MRKAPQISKYNKKLVLGLGSGRCGTKSLAYLLNAQKNVDVSHEFGNQPLLPWKFQINKLNKAIKIMISRRANICGDVAFYWLPYIDYIINNYKDVYIIVLKRDRDDTVQSYIKWTDKHKYWEPGNIWDKSYPQHRLKYKNKKEFFSFYWDMYYNKVKALKINKNCIYEMCTGDLNDYDKVNKMMKFLKINDFNWEKIHLNSSSNKSFSK